MAAPTIAKAPVEPRRAAAALLVEEAGAEPVDEGAVEEEGAAVLVLAADAEEVVLAESVAVAEAVWDLLCVGVYVEVIVTPAALQAALAVSIASFRSEGLVQEL